MSKDGIETDPKKMANINKQPILKTGTEVQSFLGFTNYYQKFIPKYVHTTRPINQLVSGKNASKEKTFSGIDC